MRRVKCIPIFYLLLYLSACTPAQAPQQVCPAAVHPDEKTRAWLHTLTPPPEAVHYFNLIADQQEAIEKVCP